MNPYQPPNTLDREQPSLRERQIGLTVSRTLFLALGGYCIYVIAVMLFSILDPAIRLADGRWYWGLLVSLALASSEIFRLTSHSLKSSAMRRIMISSIITLGSVILTQLVAIICRWEISGYDEPKILPRLLVGVPIYVCLIIVTRRALTMRAVDRKPQRGS